MRRNSTVIAGALAACFGVGVVLLTKRQPEDRTIEIPPPSIPPPSIPVEPPPAPPALPTPVVRGEEEFGHGQALSVALLALGVVLAGGLLMAYILPPALYAPSLAFGPVLLLGFLVALHQLRTKGLALGDPPE